jgi:hypothetical protein
MEPKLEPPLDLPVGLLGQTDSAGLGDALEPRGNRVRPMGHRDGESASAPRKELRRMGSALFGNHFDRVR